jgi:hypothetical protein
MKTKAFFLAAIVALSASATAGGLPPAGGDPKPTARSATGLTAASAAKCEGDGTTCTIAVTVSGCTIGVKPEYVIVTGKKVLLRWVIQTKGYTFPGRDGIFFKKGLSAGAEGEFEDCRPTGAATWQCLDKNAKPPMIFKYGINVLKPDGAPCGALDPTIINDMP